MFGCEGESLLGILSEPAQPAETGLLVIVGGPQYRVGSHRQFVHLCRWLGERSIACFRFDYRGMGDSSGVSRNFESIDEDIRAGVDAFLAAMPRLKRIVLWGLCDGAAAANYYGFRDSRVAGMVLLNPWVRTAAGEAQTYLQHYYARRLSDPDFWRKFLSGQLNIFKSANSLLKMVVAACKGATGRAAGHSGTGDDEKLDRSLSLPDRFAVGLRRFQGEILVILSGNDLTAAEFMDAADKSPDLRNAISKHEVEILNLPNANHTFSSDEWRSAVAEMTYDWIVRRVESADAGTGSNR